MDPLSDVLALLDAESYAAGGFALGTANAVEFHAYEGIKCYAVLSGDCWLQVAGQAPLLLREGDCVLLPRGHSFSIGIDLALPRITAEELRRTHREGGPFMVGGYFHPTGHHAEFLLGVLPPIVHIRDEAQKATMRWSLERLRDELRDAKPGASLVTRQLAYMMLLQALRLHLEDPAFRGVGWLFALADKQMNAAISLMHDAPGQAWTVAELAERVGMSRSVFALRFKETVGETPIEYLTRWRMLRASQRLRASTDSIAEIAVSLGYESDSAFRKAFRGVMGVSPNDFRRSDDRADRPDSPT